MAMTEALATTGAQTIPVFALAGVVEVKTAMSRPWVTGAVPGTVVGYVRARVQAALKTLFIAAWVIIGLTSFFAEVVCIDYLRTKQAPSSLDVSMVVFALEASLALLVIYPLYVAFFTVERRSEEAKSQLAEVREELRRRRRRGDRLVDILLRPPANDRRGEQRDERVQRSGDRPPLSGG